MGGSPASNAKGKGKEVVDENESLQAQINQLRESMLSVQVGEVSLPIEAIPGAVNTAKPDTLADIRLFFSYRTHTLSDTTLLELQMA